MIAPLFPSPYPVESVEQQYARVTLSRGYGKKYKSSDNKDFVFELSELSGQTFSSISEDAWQYVDGGCGIVG